MSDKKFILQVFDKFDEKTTTTSNPKMITVKMIKTRETPWPTYNLGIRHVKNKDFESLLIDAHFGGREWFFLRNGNIIFSTSKGPVKVSPEVHGDSDVHSGGIVEEHETYPISKDDFLKICESDTLEMKITGSSTYITTNSPNFLILCQQFYNNFYDSSKFTTSLEKQAKGACFIATVTMDGYDNPKVIELRQFRDEWILKRTWGEAFVNWYYYYGAKAAKAIEFSFVLKKLSYLFIVMPLVAFSKIVNKNENHESK